VILAGDQRQLPPASFASSALADGEPRPAEFEEAPIPESVLDLARGSGAFSNFPLRWHYRSQHEALIAFSNAAFYGGRLFPVPGGGPDAGIELFYGEGTYRGRTTRDNPSEAARVAQRVIHHYSTRPALSLGVVTFSEAQAVAIEAALGEARKLRPDLDRFFGTDRLRGFFVKGAEAAQGDERDVLILSIGYGPDEKGQITPDFGPLGRPDGWRRLNVAATRARYRTEIVSSIRASDIPEPVTDEALTHLRRYLDYAAGPTTLGLRPWRSASSARRTTGIEPGDAEIHGIPVAVGYDGDGQNRVRFTKTLIAWWNAARPGRRVQNSICWAPGMPAADTLSMAASIWLALASSASAAKITFLIATARPRGPRRSFSGEYGSRRRAR